MKQIFVLTQPEQRLVVVLILMLVAGTWFKHHRDLQNTMVPQPAPSASATPQGTAVSTPPN